MQFRLVTPLLENLDEIEGTCLVLTSFSDDRPLRGLTGLVDWRLNGQLSRLVLNEFIDAHYQESMLAPIEGRLPFQRILLVGMGKRSDFTAERFEEVCRFCFKTLVRLDILRFAMTLPGRVGLDVGLRQALAGWRRALLDSFDAAQLEALDLVVLEAPDVQRELAEPMRTLQREIADRARQAKAVSQLS